MARPDYCPIGGEPCQSLCDTPCGKAGLTRRQRQDLLAAALYISARDDDTSVLKQDDAERIVELLTNLSGFDLDRAAAHMAREGG